MKYSAKTLVEANSFVIDAFCDSLLLPKDQKYSTEYLEILKIGTDFSSNEINAVVEKNSKNGPSIILTFPLIYSVIRVSEVIACDVRVFPHTVDLHSERINYGCIDESLDEIVNGSWLRFNTEENSDIPSSIFEFLCDENHRSEHPQLADWSYIIAKSALSYIVLHEQFHYFRGHLEYSGNLGTNSHKHHEVKNKESSPQDEGHKLSEFEADQAAFEEIFRFILVENVLSGKDRDGPTGLSVMRFLFGALGASIAMAIFLQVREKVNYNTNNYPSLECRLSMLFRSLSNNVGYMFTYNEQNGHYGFKSHYGTRVRVMRWQEAAYLSMVHNTMRGAFIVLGFAPQLADSMYAAMLSPNEIGDAPDWVKEMFDLNAHLVQFKENGNYKPIDCERANNEVSEEFKKILLDMLRDHFARMN